MTAIYRVTEDGNQRVTETGDQRVTEDSVGGDAALGRTRRQRAFVVLLNRARRNRRS